MLTPDRIETDELLDVGQGSDDDVAKNLSDLRRINRYIRVSRVMAGALSELFGVARPERLSLLDVGTGSGDVPQAIGGWCRSLGIESSITALDVSERNVRVARSRLGISSAVSLLVADGFHLPFDDRRFDFVTASHFLHHFSFEQIPGLIAEMARTARIAVIINDLVRSLIPYYFVRLVGPALTDCCLTLNDGPVSILRGFTAAELSRLAELAGLRCFRVERVFPYRLNLVATVRES